MEISSARRERLCIARGNGNSWPVEKIGKHIPILITKNVPLVHTHSTGVGGDKTAFEGVETTTKLTRDTSIITHGFR